MPNAGDEMELYLERYNREALRLMEGGAMPKLTRKEMETIFDEELGIPTENMSDPPFAFIPNESEETTRIKAAVVFGGGTAMCRFCGAVTVHYATKYLTHRMVRCTVCHEVRGSYDSVPKGRFAMPKFPEKWNVVRLCHDCGASVMHVRTFQETTGEWVFRCCSCGLITQAGEMSVVFPASGEGLQKVLRHLFRVWGQSG